MLKSGLKNKCFEYSVLHLTYISTCIIFTYSSHTHTNITRTQTGFHFLTWNIERQKKDDLKDLPLWWMEDNSDAMLHKRTSESNREQTHVECTHWMMRALGSNDKTPSPLHSPTPSQERASFEVRFYHFLASVCLFCVSAWDTVRASK